SDPAHPVAMDSYSPQSFPTAICSFGEHAYLLNWQGIEVLNAHDPGHPTKVGAYDVQGASKMEIVENHLYLLFAHTLQILDLGNPAKPNLMATYTEPESTFSTVHAAGQR